MSSSVGFTGGRQVVEFRPSRDQDWTAQAACADEFVDLMYPTDEDHKGIAAAKQVCGTCPVAESCLTSALDHCEQFGVWGGTTPGERSSMRRRAANQRYRSQA